jgi:hypothetical protein
MPERACCSRWSSPARLILTALVITGPALTAPQLRAAQPEPEVVPILDVVDRFMRAISTNDVTALASLTLEGTTTTVEAPSPEGGTRLTRRTLEPQRYAKGAFREQYWDPVVHVRGRLAVVWTPYEFWLNGKTSHCGIDVFHMVRQDDGWRIAHIMWTVEHDACPALRPADAARIRPAL